MNILVTGGAGFTGSTFIKYMLDKYPMYQINVVDNLSSGNLSNLMSCHSKSNFQFFLGNISDVFVMDLLVEESDLIINFADEKHEINMSTTNSIGVQNIMEIISKLDTKKRFIHIGDYSVYGGYSIHPSREEDILKPISPHAASRASADLLVNAYNHSNDIPTSIIRFSSIYGGYQSPKAYIPNMIISMIKDEEFCVPNGNYELMHVLDQCRIIDKVIHSSRKFSTLNAGSGYRCSMTEVAHIIRKILKKDCPIIVDRISKPIQHGVSSDRAMFELGKYKAIDINDGLAQTIKWYISNVDWWRNLI